VPDGSMNSCPKPLWVPAGGARLGPAQSHPSGGGASGTASARGFVYAGDGATLMLHHTRGADHRFDLGRTACRHARGHRTHRGDRDLQPGATDTRLGKHQSADRILTSGRGGRSGVGLRVNAQDTDGHAHQHPSCDRLLGRTVLSGSGATIGQRPRPADCPRPRRTAADSESSVRSTDVRQSHRRGGILGCSALRRTITTLPAAHDRLAVE